MKDFVITEIITRRPLRGAHLAAAAEASLRPRRPHRRLATGRWGGSDSSPGTPSTPLAASSRCLLPSLAAGPARCRTTPRAAGLGRRSPACSLARRRACRGLRSWAPTLPLSAGGSSLGAGGLGLRRRQLSRLPPVRGQRAPDTTEEIPTRIPGGPERTLNSLWLVYMSIYPSYGLPS